jgi:hypothetical protein
VPGARLERLGEAMHGDAPPLGTRLTIEAVDELPVNRQSSNSTPDHKRRERCNRHAVSFSRH